MHLGCNVLQCAGSLGLRSLRLTFTEFPESSTFKRKSTSFPPQRNPNKNLQKSTKTWDLGSSYWAGPEWLSWDDWSRTATTTVLRLLQLVAGGCVHLQANAVRSRNGLTTSAKQPKQWDKRHLHKLILLKSWLWGFSLPFCTNIEFTKGFVQRRGIAKARVQPIAPQSSLHFSVTQGFAYNNKCQGL